MPPATDPRSVRRPVRRARQARSKATVEAIIEAATRILAGDGWDRLTTNAVAEQAGVSIGSLYEYFPNKAAILDVIVDRHLAEAESLIDERSTSTANDLPPAEVVARLVAGFVDVHRANPSLHRALATAVPLSASQRARIDALRTRSVALVAAALAGQVDRAEIRATLLVDAADAIVHRWLIDEVGVPVAPELMQAELTAMLSAYAGAGQQAP